MKKPKTVLRTLIIWTLLFQTATAQVVENIYLELNAEKKGDIMDCDPLLKRHIIKDFQLPSDSVITYRIEIFEDSTATLSLNKKGKWFLLDTLSHYSWILEDTTGTIEFPVVRLTDFNEDGHTDFEIWLNTNMNGNKWVKLFLYNPETHQLQILPNDAEEDDIWDAPLFNKQDNTIHCYREASVWGCSYHSVYKLDGLKATPIYKKVHDRSQMDMYGKGAVYQLFVGDKQMWKLKKEKRYRAK